MSHSNPIGLFDSGFGGLTVLNELAKLLPNENFIYFGDTANIPYGNKSPEKILQLSLENGSFLLKKGIKLLLIPCHTACAHSLETIKKILPIPVLGVTSPCITLLKPFKRVAILATKRTIDSGIYQSLILKQTPNTELHSVPCPLFVPLIEEGYQNHPSTYLIAQSYLAPLKGKIDAALLGCTHYPLMKGAIQQALGNTELLDPAKLCALEAQEKLRSMGLLNTQNKKGSHQFFSSDDPQKFKEIGALFLDFIPNVIQESDFRLC